MKIFAIRDESSAQRKDIAYLFYYEGSKRFYIELPENASIWETPPLLSSLLEKGETSVDSHWSEIWVRQRIVPRDRQNIGQILRKHGLREYDEFKLLMIANGRCAQDDYYLTPIGRADLPAEIQKRFLTKVEDLIPLKQRSLLIFFRDGAVKKCALASYFESDPRFGVLLENENYFFDVRIQPGGYGVSWGENLMISDRELYKSGKKLPLTAEDFENFVKHRVVSAGEAAELLDCSRQYVDELQKKGLLRPLKASGRVTLYSKSEILKRLW